LGVYLFKTKIGIKQHLANQAIRSLHNLSTVCNQMDIITCQNIDLFDTLVLPILHYTSQTWGIHWRRWYL